MQGRVALVTGAGRGIGKAHALILASRGAAVLVNDLGVELDGSGGDSQPADDVVAEITSAGGRAVADNTDIGSITGGAAAVQATLDAYSCIDIVINNAGIAGGAGTIEEPEEAGLDALFAVHFKGAIGTMSAAFPHMRGQRFGRIIDTVSEVALDARFAGGLGYEAAKAAIWSATLTAAREGAPHGITANAVSPGARTRMNKDILDAGFREGASDGLDLDPKHVARLAAYLATEEAGDITGRIIHAAGGAIREYTTSRTSTSTLVARLMNALKA